MSDPASEYLRAMRQPTTNGHAPTGWERGDAWEHPRDRAGHQQDQGAREGGPAAVVRTLADVQARPVEWIWRHWVPRGTLTLVDGDPGLGKSTLLLDLAARVSRGWAMPPGGGAVDGIAPEGVLLLSAEDDAECTIRPRLDAAGADVSKVAILEAVRVNGEDRPPVLPWDLGLLGSLIKERGIGLVVVDPLMAYLDGEVNSHVDQDIRRCMHALKSLAERTSVAIVLIRHLNKMNHAVAIYRGGGSIGIIGAVRAAHVVGRDPDDPDVVRVLAPVKCNLSPMPKALAYTLEHVGDVARIAWKGEVDLTADEIVAHSEPTRRQSREEQAEAAVRELLRGRGLESDALDARLRAMGFSANAIRQGRKRARVCIERDGFGGSCLVRLPQATEDEERP